MQSGITYTGLNLLSPENSRTRLFLDYEEELNRLSEYVDMYRRSSKTRLIPQDSIDFVTTVLDQSEALLGLNRSLIPQEPKFTSVYTKTTSSGNPRPTLTAYDLKRFHGFRNQVTDLVVLEGIRDVHAVLIHFAETGTAEAFAHAAFGLEFAAPYIQTTEAFNGTEFYVINILFNDESMKLTTVRETYSFLNRFAEAYPNLPHIFVEMNQNGLYKIFLDKKKVLETAEAYKNGRPLAPEATAGFSLLGNFAFHQEGWSEAPEQFKSSDSIIESLVHMQLDMIPTYNRLLKDGLEVLQDDRSFLPQTELEYVRERVDLLIWDEIMNYFSKGITDFEKIYTLLLSHKTIDAQAVKAIVEAKESFDLSRQQMSHIRANFSRIVPRLSGLRSVGVGAEYMQTIRELEKAYALISGDKKKTLHFIDELRGFGNKSTTYTLPRIVAFYGFLKIIMAVFTELSLQTNANDESCYIHSRFSPLIIKNEGYVNMVIYSKGVEIPNKVLSAINDPFQNTVPGKNKVHWTIKQLQDLFSHIYKVELILEGQKNTTNANYLKDLFHLGNLSQRKDELAKHKGFYIELNLPAFGRIEDFKMK